MELTNEIEKQVCPRCGSSEYDSETGSCSDCGWRTDAEEPVIPEVRQDLYLDRCTCPVCGKSELLMEGSVCKVCGWLNDSVQADDPDEECGLNELSLNQAREAYSKGLPVR